MKNLKMNQRPRTPEVITDIAPASDGSVLYRCGNTAVICAASISTDVPDHARISGKGWVTAEYTMLPYSTSPRIPRRTERPDGRAIEIQRLIGRSLRAIIDLEKLAGFTITVDCDVLQADGGTRTAAITGGCIALHRAIKKLVEEKMIPASPLTGKVAAISAGYVDGELLLDLVYREDSRAEVDLNLVMDDSGRIIEIQGTGEKRSFCREELNEIIAICTPAIEQLFELQGQYS